MLNYQGDDLIREIVSTITKVEICPNVICALGKDSIKPLLLTGQLNFSIHNMKTTLYNLEVIVKIT